MQEFIKQETYNPLPPVSVEREANDIVIIEGVRYAGDFFRTISLPPADKLFFMRRKGDTVIVTVIGNAEGAKLFFEMVAQGVSDENMRQELMKQELTRDAV